MKGKDHLSTAQRSRNMARVSGQDTKPERLVRSYLHRRGFRFRKNVSSLPGKPDIVLPKYRTVIFVHGCFWHRHNCKRGQSIPTNRQEFWLAKFAKNVRRDEVVHEQLTVLGYRILVVWECELKKSMREQTLTRLATQLSDLPTSSSTSSATSSGSVTTSSG